MKQLSIIFLLTLALSQPLFAQTYCTSYSIVSLTATQVTVKVSLMGSSAFNLGDANVVMNFNANALSSPTLVSNTLGNVYYQATNVTNPAAGMASLNLDFNGSAGQGVAIATTATEIAQIRFNITNANQTTGISVNANYSVLYKDAITALNIGSGCPSLDVVLPLEWLYFQARTTTEKGLKAVHLEWVTASEQNIQHFIVERSRDGKTFEKVGNLVAANNNNSKNYYHVVDTKPWRGVSFYRIHEVAFSGKESYSPVRSVILDEDTFTFTVYPNPKDKYTPLSIQTNWTENYTFNLYDVIGKLIYSRACKGSLELEHFDLTSGLYFYECKTFQTNTTGKIVVP